MPVPTDVSRFDDHHAEHQGHKQKDGARQEQQVTRVKRQATRPEDRMSAAG